MLQIIGWLLCVYLVVKGFELVAMRHNSAYIGAAIAFLAAPIFLLMINAQASSQSSPLGQLGASAVDGTPMEDYASAAANLEAAADAAVQNALDAAGSPTDVQAASGEADALESEAIEGDSGSSIPEGE